MLSRRRMISHGIGSWWALSSKLGYADASNEALFDNIDVGVASGDPTPNSVNLWTRIPAWGRKTSESNVGVRLQVATDQTFSNKSIIRDIRIVANAENDFTINYSCTHLDPGTYYYYKFSSDYGYVSVVGRTKTLPISNVPVRFATTSCQSFTAGYYNSYLDMVNRDIDFCLQLGDFIYEQNAPFGPIGRVRKDISVPGDAQSLSEYRNKYKYYLSDPNLRLARQNFPFINIWDDHEFLNNHGSLAITLNAKRYLDAQKAYAEYIPITVKRSYKPNSLYSIYRKFSAGTYFDLFATDGRQYRSWQNDTLLGLEQKAWLKKSLTDSAAQWKLIMTPVMFTPLKLGRFQKSDFAGLNINPDEDVVKKLIKSPKNIGGGFVLNPDAWDGFINERRDVVEYLYDSGVKNTVFFAGDIHTAFDANVLLDENDANSPIVANEVVTTSLTSHTVRRKVPLAPAKITNVLTNLVRSSNLHLEYADFNHNGYTLCELNKNQMTIQHMAVDATDKTPKVSVISRSSIENQKFNYR